MAVLYSDNFRTTLASAVAAGATSFTVNSVANAPSGLTAGAGNWAYITIGWDGQNEIRKCTVLAGNTFICDAFVGNWQAGTPVTLALCKSFIADVRNELIPYPDRPPTTPNALNDEFDVLSVSAAWTGSTTGSATLDYGTAWPGAVSAKLTASNASTMLSRADVPAGDWTIALKVIGRINSSDDKEAAVYLWDTNKNNAIRFNVAYKTSLGGTICSLSSKDSGVWTFNRSYIAVLDCEVHYILLKKTGSVYELWHSYSGKSFLLVGSYTKSFSPALLDLSFAAGISLPSPVRLGAEWLRWNFINVP